MGNPFVNMPGLPEPEEMIEAALRRGSKATVGWITDRKKRLKLLNIRRIVASSSYVESRFRRVVNWWRGLGNVDPFYDTLLDIIVGRDKFKAAIRRLEGAVRIVERLRGRYISAVARAEAEETGKLWREFFGRLASVVRRNRNHIEVLRMARARLSALPSIERDVPTVVVAGPPNVGKSSLIRRISTSKTEVASYPFTTRKILVGHIFIDPGLVIQIMDTPGLLDRPIEERNPIERQAIAALAHAADLAIFMMDPSETCGYPIGYQLKVLESVSNMLSKLPTLIVLNKMDLMGFVLPEKVAEMLGKMGIDEFWAISAETGYNVDKLLERIVSILRAEARPRG